MRRKTLNRFGVVAARGPKLRPRPIYLSLNIYHAKWNNIFKIHIYVLTLFSTIMKLVNQFEELNFSRFRETHSSVFTRWMDGWKKREKENEREKERAREIKKIRMRTREGVGKDLS